jgi:ribosome-binding factor A
METRRKDRVGELLIELISDLLVREVSDPRIGAVALTRVEVTRDLRQARVYFTLLDEARDKAEATAGFKSATSFIRKRVARRLSLRVVPALEFIFDETHERARRIGDLLERIKAESSED